MDLIKKNIHMNKLKCKSSIQLTLDDDFNVPDVKPDIDRIIKEQGEVCINDVKAMNGKLMVNGTLKFNILYISDEDTRPVHNIIGEIPFDEMINMDEACAEDNISVKWELDDLTTNLINSRKLSVKSIVSFVFMAEDIYDEETAVAVEGEEEIQYINKRIDVTQIAINKKDTYRIKDEFALPSSKPNMFELLYNDACLRNIDVRLLEDKINLKGEIALFVLYTGEDEENPIQYIETEIPFNGVIDCNGSKEEMISDIDMTIQTKDLEIKPDSDGEERVIDIEVILNLDIKAYEEEELEILSDVYSTSKELVPTIQDAYYENLLVKNNSKARIVDRVKVREDQPAILQICNASGTAKLDDMRVMDSGIEVDGVVDVQILYITEDDNKPLNSLKGVIPFSQMVEVKGIHPNCIYDMKPSLDQLSVIMLDSEEIEIKASISLNTIVFDKIKESIITDLRVEDISLDKLQTIPSMVGYLVKPEDTLWNIAKKYYTTMDEIKEINEMESDRLTVGEKLLILKAVNAIL